MAAPRRRASRKIRRGLEFVPDQYAGSSALLDESRISGGVTIAAADEHNLRHCVSGATLRAACRGEGLPDTGPNTRRAQRLLEAGLTVADIIAGYGCRARLDAAREDSVENDPRGGVA